MKIWRIHFKGREWCSDWLAWHWVPDQISGMNYAGLTVCGLSIIYSEVW